jgi:hypothetical protein
MSGMTDVPAPSRDRGETSPPVIYLPVHLDEEGQVKDVRLIQLADGRVALLAYTALDRLVDACGDAQPWTLVESSKVLPAGDGQPYDVRFLDVSLPDELRRTGEGHEHTP